MREAHRDRMSAVGFLAVARWVVMKSVKVMASLSVAVDAACPQDGAGGISDGECGPITAGVVERRPRDGENLGPGDEIRREARAEGRAFGGLGTGIGAGAAAEGVWHGSGRLRRWRRRGLCQRSTDSVDEDAGAAVEELAVASETLGERLG
jgi:hypothetical protein